jgi:catechol 2,3-dioxygenase-like lactoylglutathione lyase family enzyme
MQTYFGHMQLNIRPENLPFYRNLMSFLGWRTIVDEPDYLGVGGPHRASLWFSAQNMDIVNNYDGPGMNHLGIGAESQADVDAVAAYLRDHGVELLFDTPQHRPEFAAGDEHTYYQVMFETPDRILIEVVYIGPKQD